MSSLEISELTGKRHDNVMADGRSMLEQLGVDVLSFQGIYRDARNRPQTCLNLPKRECLILISGYSVELRAAIIDRWAELEALATPRIPTHIEALRLAADALEKAAHEEAQKVIAQERVKVLEPKAAIVGHTMNMQINLPALGVSEFEGEPRVLDTDLAKALGMEKPEDIRRTIKAHELALAQLGLIAHRPINTGKRGRPGTSYWLNEEQALYVTMHCRTERAEAVKVQLVKVFTAWRRGALVPVQQAQAALPNFMDPEAACEAWLVEYRGRKHEEAQKVIAQERVKVLEPKAAIVGHTMNMHVMPTVKRPASLTLAVIDNEPRVLDTALAGQLGITEHAMIRRLIKAHEDELLAFGVLSCREITSGAKGGRPGKAFYLNRPQALLICILSRTEKAKEVRAEVIRCSKGDNPPSVLILLLTFCQQPIRRLPRTLGNPGVCLRRGVSVYVGTHSAPVHASFPLPSFPTLGSP